MNLYKFLGIFPTVGIPLPNLQTFGELGHFLLVVSYIGMGKHTDDTTCSKGASSSTTEYRRQLEQSSDLVPTETGTQQETESPPPVPSLLNAVSTANRQLWQDVRTLHNQVEEERRIQAVAQQRQRQHRHREEEEDTAALEDLENALLTEISALRSTENQDDGDEQFHQQSRGDALADHLVETYTQTASSAAYQNQSQELTEVEVTLDELEETERVLNIGKYRGGV